MKQGFNFYTLDLIKKIEFLLGLNNLKRTGKAIEQSITLLIHSLELTEEIKVENVKEEDRRISFEISAINEKNFLKNLTKISNVISKPISDYYYENIIQFINKNNPYIYLIQSNKDESFFNAKFNYPKNSAFFNYKVSFGDDSEIVRNLISSLTKEYPKKVKEYDEQIDNHNYTGTNLYIFCND